jgi:hypothetical protein
VGTTIAMKAPARWAFALRMTGALVVAEAISAVLIHAERSSDWGDAALDGLVPAVVITLILAVVFWRRERL